MISFIIIGKNEGRTIEQAIKSILNVIANTPIVESEIIYVDSKSSDYTLDIVKAYPQIKCFEITEICNAAVARNIGAIESKGDILCFIDADMELQIDFIKDIIKDNKLIYPFISGQLKNYFYDNYKNWSLVSTNFLHKNLTQDRYEATTGGYFIINRDAWFSVSGMNTKYRRSQDIDFGLRLALSGTKLLRKKVLMVKHHTIDYQNKERRWEMLFDGGIFFISVLFRDHLLNKQYFKVLFRNNYTLIFLIFTIIISFYSTWFLCLYFSLLFLRILFQKGSSALKNLFRRYIYFLTVDILSLIGLFFYFPKAVEIKYK